MKTDRKKRLAQKKKLVELKKRSDLKKKTERKRVAWREKRRISWDASSQYIRWLRRNAIVDSLEGFKDPWIIVD